MTRHDDITPEQFAADRLDVSPGELPSEELVFLSVADGGDVANRPPTVDIVASARTGDEVGLAADATDPDGSIQSYEWQVDGEVVSRARTLDTQFDESGEKTVSVTVTDDEGAKGSATLQVSVEGEPELPRQPLSIEGTNSPVLEGETMWVTALVENNGSEAIEPSIQGVVEPTDGSGSPLGAGTKSKQPTLDPGGAACLTFAWETGPGDGGTYEATVSAGDGDGGTTSDSQTVEISAAPNASPTVDIIAETTSSVIGEQVAFAAEATDPDGSISTYEWRVDGESVSSSGALLTQAFGEDGERTVAVTVTDDEGATDTSYQTITVEPDNRPPTAAFDWDPSNPDPGEQTFFDASASTETYGEIESYEWDFGDGHTGKGKKPTHRFPNGEYSVSLTVTDDEGATDTTTQEIAVTFR